VLHGAREAGQATANGLVVGTTFALGAVGLALVFGVLRLVNFAHGDMLTLGAYVALVLNVTLGAPILIAGAVAVAVTAAVAVTGELILWRPLRARGAGLFQMLLVAIGLAFVLRYGIQLVAGSQPQRLDVDVTRAIDLVGGVRIGRTQLVATLLGLAALAAVAAMLRSTRLGRQMRALADSIPLAEVSGIDTRRVILLTWLIAGALAGLAGVVAVASVGVMTPNFGFLLLLSLFAATVLGGIGSAYGALAGGLVLGLVEEWSTLFVDPRWKLAIGFAVLIATLIVRPNGLFGQAVRR
jgi:neutral amino acid transport system permease protein